MLGSESGARGMSKSSPDKSALMLGRCFAGQNICTWISFCSGRSQAGGGGTSGPQFRRRSSLYSHWFSGALSAWRHRTALPRMIWGKPDEQIAI